MNLEWPQEVVLQALNIQHCASALHSLSMYISNATCDAWMTPKGLYLPVSSKDDHPSALVVIWDSYNRKYIHCVLIAFFSYFIH